MGKTVSDKASLFDRLPNKIFRPLSGKNQRLYWAVLEKLFDDFFKGDVVQSIQGVLKPEIVDSIGRHLSQLPEYIPEEDDDDDKSLESRQVSGRIYRHLVKAGWLSVEQEGYATELILLSPVVSQLLSDLSSIAMNNPVYFGGKVQSIYNTIESSMSNPEDQALAFNHVCDDARGFSRSLSGIVVRIRDVLGRITGTTDPRIILNTFFGDYVSEILVADYKKLKTENHPFRYRSDILIAAQKIQYDVELRQRYIDGYKKSFDDTDAELKFENDVSTLIAVFSNVDRQLDRIDDIKQRLESRVNGLIRFMGRTTDLVASDIKAVITAVSKSDCDLCMPIVIDEMAAETNLFKPKKVSEPPKPSVIKKDVFNPELERRIELEAAARERRHVPVEKLLAYIERNMKGQLAISSDELLIETIEDFCAFTLLSNLSFSNNTKNLELLSLYEMYEFSEMTNEMTENDYVINPKITITRLTRRH